MGGRGHSIGIWAVLGIFVIYPLGRLVCLAFFPEGRLSAGPLTAVLSDPAVWRALAGSIGLGAAVALAGTALGLLFAFASVRLFVPRAVKSAVRAITVLPLVSPPFTTAIALTVTLGPGGAIPRLLGNPAMDIYGFWGTWIAETLTYFPVACLALEGTLRSAGIIPEEAARDLGASGFQVFRTVMLPLAIPGISNSLLVLFGLSLADFATPMVMGGHRFLLLTTQAYLRITGMYDLEGGAVMGLMLILPALAVYQVQRRWAFGQRFAVVTGKERSLTLWNPGRHCKWAILGPVAAVSFFILYLYGTILASSFSEEWGLGSGITLKHYAYVFTAGLESFKDTLTLALVSTVLAMVMALTVAFSVTRGNPFFKGAMEFTALLNSVLPGTVVGIAYAAAFNSGPLVLTGTMTVMAALCVFRYGAPAVRLLIGAIGQIDRSMEEAALDLGASKFRAFRDAAVPLILPSVVGGAKTVFAVCMTAVSALIFLVSVRWNLLTVRILESITELQFSQAAAFSVVLILTVFAVSAAMDRLARALKFS